MDLFTATREHDLPPRWDGHPITWQEWSTAPTPVCPRAQSACEECGVVGPRLTARGTISVVPDFDEGLPGEVTDLARARAERRPPTHVLIAVRCPSCMHDNVWDSRTDAVWDLDSTDYTDSGSSAPIPHENGDTP